MSTNKLSVYLNVNGAEEAETKLKKLGKHGTVALQGITTSAQPVNKSLVALNDTVGTVSKSMQAFAGIAGAYLGFQGIQGTISGIIQTNTEFQTLSSSLTVVEKDADKAAIILTKLDSLATQTPYALQSLTEAWIKLRALGLKPSEEALLSYGNTSSAMGKDIMQFIEAIADSTTFEFERLKEFGIKAKQQGDEVSFTFQGITTTVKKNSEDIEKYLRNIGETTFAGAMIQQMDTIAGATSNLGDNFARIQRTVGEAGFNEALQGLYSSISEVVASTEDGAKSFGSALGTITKGVTGVVNNLDVLKDAALAFGAFKVMQVGATATTAAMAATTLATRNMALTLAASSAIAGRAATAQIAAMSAMSVAARGLTAAMGLVGGPLGVIAIAGFSIYQFTKETDKSAEVAGKYSKELEEVRKSTQGLTDATDELTKTTGKARKIALLEQLEQIKGDMAEVQDELMNGSYWSNNWITNQWEKLDKDENFNRYIEQYKDGVIDLEGLHTRIIKLGELQPEYRDEALKFDKRYQSLKALELATERTQKKLQRLENPTPEDTTPKDTTPKLDFSNLDQLDFKTSKNGETIESLMKKAEYANSSIGKLENSMGASLDSNSWIYGALEGFDQVSNESRNFADSTKQIVTNAFDGMTNSMVEFTRTGKLNFSDLTNSIINDMIRMQMQQNVTGPLSKALSGAISGYFGGGADTGGEESISANVNHVGGIAGTPSLTRDVPTSLFANAPRYHSGGIIRQDEFHAILQKGEIVLSRNTVNSLKNTNRSTSIIVKNNVYNYSDYKATQKTTQDENGNITNDTIIEKIEGAIAENISRNRGPLNGTLRQEFKPNGANF
ncbi:MAG TPA: hypothetical protein DCL21_01490 [Alphaproteobacteria bacterium]|nr:hypothetical protein [Alphaproteobacteria bacterium]